MQAADVMVTDVITVGLNTTIHQVADILLKNRISAVPVIGEQREILGVVSEGDLIRRAESGTLQRNSWWLDLLASKQALAINYVKTHGMKVADVMTTHVITASPETSLPEIATLLETNRIKRVPIVKNGKLVGIVSRANLLQALVSTRNKKPEVDVRDSEIRKKVLARLNAEAWRPSMLNVTVHEGTVDLWGLINSDEERKAARIAVEVVPGVQGINDYMLIPPPTSGMA
jgi:CBS domain-containing protein